ncbi:MAG: response regulator [Anaerolineales bacterium]|nr:MAG: response regulator [Anaerolineales bacterium]
MDTKHTLLIVEDDPDTLEMLRVYFEAQGYQIVTAMSGHEALQKGQQHPPDLILLDVRLPDIDGFEVGKSLQDDVRTNRLPVIFVTERGERDDRITGLKLGAIDYITKPFDVQELRLRVRNALRRVGSQNNAVTGLPGNKLTNDRLSLLLERDDWSAISVNITELDTFDEIYGFVARDDVLRAVALVLTSIVDELGTMDDFVGHPSESQFLITTIPTKTDDLSQQIAKRLGQAMAYFYPIHDREAGYVAWGDDQTRRTKIPFMGVATATIQSTDGPFEDVQTLRRVLQHRLRAA